MNGLQWIKFVRVYGPLPTKDNVYDEHLQRASKRLKINSLRFTHPFEQQLKEAFETPRTTILTGTAGEGKTFLCGLIWEKVGGDSDQWHEDSEHFQKVIEIPGADRKATLHIIRDWSGWVPQQHAIWPEDKRDFFIRLASSIFEENPKEIFLIAANDGQLREAFTKFARESEIVARAWKVVEDLLLSNALESKSGWLRLYHLSKSSAAKNFELAHEAFCEHEGWRICYAEADPENPNSFFGENCPIRKNFELLQEPLLKKRIMDLLELCDQNGLHVPIRQILILLSNAVLGHSAASTKDNLMRAEDVPGILADGSRHLASIYNNIFGGNLKENRRNDTAIFTYLERFRIGTETSNRLDNILIFEKSHEQLREQFERFIATDDFYGAVPAFEAAKRDYVEGGDEDKSLANDFLDFLVSQRRALFFKIPDEEADDLHLWELTVFRYGGEYLNRVLGALRNGEVVKSMILSRLVRGLNRIFAGMLLQDERRVLLASSASLSQARVCRFLDDEISVQPRRGEKVTITLENDRPLLQVDLGKSSTGTDLGCALELTLTRYEYLSRVADGALPSSFSKECFEDLMAFKSRLIREVALRGDEENRHEITFRVLTVGEGGIARDEPITVSI